MSLKFGTSGLRGLSSELEGKPSFIYAAAFVDYLLEKGVVEKGGKVLFAYDFRPSSPAIAKNVARAISARGLTAVDCGEIPTPALAYHGIKVGAASMMITGSHIPADRNGIKFYLPTGEITKVDEQAIAARAAEIADEEILDGDAVALNEVAEAKSRFFERNKGLAAEGALRGLKVGVYQHSTVARDLMVELLSYLGADVVALGRSETFIPVDTEAVSAETVSQMKVWAAEHKLDAIVSADGDGDRPLVADETGVPIKGDLVGFLTARFLGAQVIATPISSNSGIEKAFSGQVARTRIGSPYVIEAMEAALKAGEAKIVGFEANGGTLTATDFEVIGGLLDALPTRDCFLPVIAVLATAAESGKPLSGLGSEFGLPVTEADRLQEFATERSAALLSYLLASESNAREFLKPIGDYASANTLDGLRLTLTDGAIVHFRPSGNAPEMRCYVEAPDAEQAQDLLTKGLDLLRAWEPR